jgi:hypothetical protein
MLHLYHSLSQKLIMKHVYDGLKPVGDQVNITKDTYVCSILILFKK